MHYVPDIAVPLLSVVIIIIPHSCTSLFTLLPVAIIAVGTILIANVIPIDIIGPFGEIS
jgi:hypothetical protein